MISERLILKKITENDRAQYVEQMQNDKIMHYITGGGLSLEKAHERFEEALSFGTVHPDYGIFTVWLKAENQYIGLARMKMDADDSIEIGYNLLENYWRQGYGYEIGKTLMAFLHNIKREKNVYSIVHVDNQGSKRILEKLGLVRTEKSPIDDTLTYRFPS